jgi:hypothetical protein
MSVLVVFVHVFIGVFDLVGIVWHLNLFSEVGSNVIIISKVIGD